MRAYEYSTDPQPDISQPHHKEFTSLFSNVVMELGAERLFALGVRPVSSLENYTEVELQRYQATVFIEDFELPDSFETDRMYPAKGCTANMSAVRQRASRGGREHGKRKWGHVALSHPDRKKHLFWMGRFCQ